MGDILAKGIGAVIGASAYATKGTIDGAASVLKSVTRGKSSTKSTTDNQPNSSTQAQSNNNSAAPSNKQDNVGKNNSTETIIENDSDSDSDSDRDVNIINPNGTQVQGDITYKNPTESNTDNSILENKPQIKVQKPIPEPKHGRIRKTFNNLLTSEHFDEIPYKSAPYIKDAVMIYDTIDEAIKTTNVEYPYTKLFAQTNKTKKKRLDLLKNWTTEKINSMNNWADEKINEPLGQKGQQMKNHIESFKTKLKEKRAERLKAKDKSKQEKDKLQKSKDDAETEAKKLVDDLLKINFDDIKADNDLIIQLHIKIQDVEGGPKAYITKLENEAMKGGKRGKRTRKKRQPVQKGGNNDDMEKKKKKLKIVNILKQLNSANYIDYEIESIIQELKRLLGPPSNVDTSIPKTITTTTTIQEDMYSEPLPICTDKDKNSNTTCKKNREKLENRLKYFNKLKELNAMHNDNELLAVAQSVIDGNKENIKAYYEPYAKSDDKTNDKAEKDNNYLATLHNFTKIENEATNRKIKKYNEIVDYLNNDKNKQNIVNPQLDEKLMTTNIKQTKTGDTIFSTILSVEHVLGMINNFENNPTLLKAMNSTGDGKGDPGHTKTSDITEVKSTDILKNSKK